MEAFAYRDGGFAAAMSTGEALLLRQLASEVLVVLDDPGDFASTSSMVNAGKPRVNAASGCSCPP